jgi:hypothetical protein
MQSHSSQNNANSMLVTSLMRESETRSSTTSTLSFGMGHHKGDGDGHTYHNMDENENDSSLVMQMSQNTENMRSLGDTELIEDEIDLLLPELCFLFRIAGIAVKKSDPFILNVIVFVFIWVIDIMMIVVYFNHIHDVDGRFSHLVEIYWAFHSCVIYTILSYSMYQNAQVFQMILLSASTEIDEWRSSMISTCPGYEKENKERRGGDSGPKLTSTQIKLRKHSRVCVFVVIFSVLFNVIMLIATRFDEFLYRHLPWSESVFFNLIGVVAWYFYSFHWFVAVICVYLPVHFFSNKVKRFIHFLENSLTGFDRGEVIKAMEWYDDLYKVNKLMNFGSLSLMATTTLFMLMLLLIALLLSLVKDGEVKGPTFFWIGTNTAVIACIAYTVAELETANKK